DAEVVELLVDDVGVLVDVVVVTGAATVLLVVVGTAAVVVVVAISVVGVLPSSKLAVHVVSVSGVSIVCTWTPPSDHPVNVYGACCTSAPIVRTTPTTPVTCTGVVTGCPSRVSARPGGLVSRRMIAVHGGTNSSVSLVRPDELVARRMIQY